MNPLRPRYRPGQYGDSFDRRLRDGRLTPGEIGQFVNYDNRFTRVASYQEVVEYVASKLDGILPAFGWKAGDANAPSHWLGAANSDDKLTRTGTPVPGKTPWVSSEGAVASEVYDGLSCRAQSAVAVDPAVTDDVICIANITETPSTNVIYVCGTYNATTGWVLHGSSASMVITFRDTGFRTVTTPKTPYGTAIYIVMLRRSTNKIQMYKNGTYIGEAAVDAGFDYATNNGIGIGARADGALSTRYIGNIGSVTTYYGTSIADAFNADSAALVKQISRMLDGTQPRQGNAPTVTRATAAAWHGGLAGSEAWGLASSGMPCAGDADGLRAQPARTNDCFRNVNPANITALTYSGATAPTVVDDSAALAAVTPDATSWGPAVYNYNNDTGSTQYIRFSANSGDTDERSLQVLIRLLAGAGVQLGHYDESAGTFANGVAIHDGYDQLTKNEGITPADTDITACLSVPTGAHIRFIAQDRQKGLVCTDPIPNWAVATPTTRNVLSFDTNESMDDAGGKLECEFTPLGWSGIEPGEIVRVVSRITTPSDILYAGHAVAGYKSDTGLSICEIADAPADGVTQKLSVAWNEGTGRNLLRVDSDFDVDSYGGSLSGAGDLGIVPVGAESAIRNLRMYRNGPAGGALPAYPRIRNDQSTLLATSLSIACPAGAGNAVTVYWGDGTSTALTCDGTVRTVTKNYAATGTYQVSVVGDVDAITTFICWYQPWLSGAYSNVIAGLQNVAKLHIWGCSFTGSAGDFDHLLLVTDLLYTRGANLLADGDMEAVGVAAWIAADCSIAKGTTTLYTGLRYIRCTRTAATYGIFQIVLTNGKTYRMTGAVRCSTLASEVPRVIQASGTGIWTSSASADWEAFDFTFVSTGDRVLIWDSAGTAGAWVDWDALYITEVV